MRIPIKAALVYFFAVFAAGFLLGTVRVLFLVPKLGELPAVLLEIPLILTISWFVCRMVTTRVPVGEGIGARLAMGANAFVLLMVVEWALGVFAFGRSPAEIAAAYGEAAGLIGLMGQVGFALIPLLQRPPAPQARA
tara:strand:+ start:9832 stop:10242 length:411 start_codon:yes stop_codon:yes gene_type:complete